jgi:hypothetical protein
MLQHIRCRLKGRLTNLVHADRVPTIVARRDRTARGISRRDVHNLRLRRINARRRGH